MTGEASPSEPGLGGEALGFAEAAFLSVTAVIADEMVKAAEVTLLGIETTGSQDLAIRVRGAVAAVQAALEAAERRGAHSRIRA